MQGLDKRTLEPSLREVLEIPTVKLWRAILDTETESYPNIEISGEVVPVADAHGGFFPLTLLMLIHLGAFRSSDEVEALQVDQEGVERFIGEVSLKVRAQRDSSCQS